MLDTPGASISVCPTHFVSALECQGRAPPRAPRTPREHVALQVCACLHMCVDPLTLLRMFAWQACWDFSSVRVYSTLIGCTSCIVKSLSPVDPSFRALSGRQRGNSFRLCQTVPISDSIFSARCPRAITRGPPPSSFLIMELLELELVMVSRVAK